MCRTFQRAFYWSSGAFWSNINPPAIYKLSFLFPFKVHESRSIVDNLVRFSASGLFDARYSVPYPPAACDRPEAQLRGHAQEVRQLQRAQLQHADEDRVQENVQDA